MNPAAKLRRTIATGLPIDNPQSVLDCNRKCVIRILTKIASEFAPTISKELIANEVAAGTEYELLELLRPHLSPDIREHIDALIEFKKYAERQLS